MARMFADCADFNQALDICTDSATDMSDMFSNCHKLDPRQFIISEVIKIPLHHESLRQQSKCFPCQCQLLPQISRDMFYKLYPSIAAAFLVHFLRNENCLQTQSYHSIFKQVDAAWLSRLRYAFTILMKQDVIVRSEYIEAYLLQCECPEWLVHKHKHK